MTARSTHLILVPGLGCTEKIFAEQIAAMRGDVAISVADHTRHDTISGIARAILAVAPKRFALCGLSMGGYIAFEMMRQAPDRIERLAFLDTTALSDTPEQTERRLKLIAMAQSGEFSSVCDTLWPLFVHTHHLQNENRANPFSSREMFLLSRRKLIAGASASAAAGFAGCVNTNPNPAVNAAVADAVGPNYDVIYAERKDGAFIIPAVQFRQIDSAFLRQNVAYATKESPGTIVIDPANHLLYHVEDGGRATRYGVGVGREGFGWAGEARIKSKQEWPDWYPPKEMLDRRPDLMKAMVELQSGIGMHGGPANPLGARAMYLWQGTKDTYFRIHGTNEPWTIGQSVSSGCIRMINQDAVALYQKTPIGTRVVVLTYPGAMPAKVAHI